MDHVSVREALLLTFETDKQRSRTLSVPNPLPNLNPIEVSEASSLIVQSDIFDGSGVSGSPTRLEGAVKERVTTRVVYQA